MPTAGTVRATIVQNKLFVVAGSVINNAVVLKAYSYDPVTNIWKSKAAPPTGGALARIQLDGRARVLSVGGAGYFDSPPVASQLYTP
jgi:N-acetylneuraminic acid mutarotase